MFSARAKWAAFAIFLPLAEPMQAALFPDHPFSDQAAGTTGANFLKQLPGARAQAMGGSYVSAADNSESIYWNPAGLARMMGSGLSEVSFSYNNLLETSYASSLAYALPLSQGRGVFGASLIYFSQSAIQGYSVLGDPNGSFTPRDYAVSAAYANKLGPALLGGSLKVVRSELADASGTTFAADLGIQVLGSEIHNLGESSVDFGASVQNLGPAINMGAHADPLPFQFSAGPLWHITPKDSILLEGHFPVDQDPYVSLGGEASWPFSEGIKGALRAGFNVRNQRSIGGIAGFTAGLGLDLTRLRLDYAWVPFGDLGTTHRISMGVRF